MIVDRFQPKVSTNVSQLVSPRRQTKAAEIFSECSQQILDLIARADGGAGSFDPERQMNAHVFSYKCSILLFPLPAKYSHSLRIIHHRKQNVDHWKGMYFQPIEVNQGL